MRAVLERLKHDFRLNAGDEAILDYVVGHLKQVQRMSSHQLAKETYSSPTAVIGINVQDYNVIGANSVTLVLASIILSYKIRYR